MGQRPKYQIEEDKRAKRQAKLDKKRKVGGRPQNVSFLIVCEGERTEPKYFESFIRNRCSQVTEVRVEGEGRGTLSLVKQAIKIRDKSAKPYDRVWAVFDKDDFQDFNQAINYAKKHQINCAWSNESFELWYYLHFQYLDTGISRSDYIQRIEREIRNRTNDPSFRYEKKSDNNYFLINNYGNMNHAITHAKRLCSNHRGNNYDSHLPCTKIHLLIDELLEPTKLLEQDEIGKIKF